MGTQKDSPEQMLSAHAWLEQVAEELGLPQDVVRASVKDVLDLTSAVAHHRSRPAAPVTAFLIGLAAGRAAGQDQDLYAEAHPRVERITTLALDGISEQP
ncbi:MAG: DUF6457 domain-containing protein [Corynebacterium sp.]|uniref:DUF6457 domain-containing protein n=1 Tax=unclassified Corynebacterium TaxID=2624378 RepID=UPI0026487EDB|nr:DUF6457 domain-containing protein [Corynebacterium sp.]MDN5582656.1 DUF6457 domain-containing protein [Corynebacterium sp.]MDN5720185.1 DUF6457 domain-containing protein [Corynebacterium sp.]MDN6324344.1 DUF6457 domain-containing protein [Corynebacterium sp.]MDN6509728.1 DUF6457 domain-containing protein [Corynebacterium sp.]